VDATQPSEVDGSSDGSAKQSSKEGIDTLLERLLVGELRIKVDPLTGEIVGSDGIGADRETPPRAP
jgi:hypothetical protein